METEKIIGAVENILFMAGDAVGIVDLAQALDIPQEQLQQILQQEMQRRAYGAGLLIKQFEDRVQLCTRPEYAELIVNLLGEKNEEALSKAMLETLSIIAYRQPVTREEVERVRGVNSSYTINTLLDKELIYVAGRKDALGRPKLYATSQAFLRYFDLQSLEDLPELRQEEEAEQPMEQEELS